MVFLGASQPQSKSAVLHHVLPSWTQRVYIWWQAAFYIFFSIVFSILCLLPFLYSFILYLKQKRLFFHAREENTLTVAINIIILLSYILVFTVLSRINSSNLCYRISSPYIKVETRDLIYLKIRSVFPK